MSGARDVRELVPGQRLPARTINAIRQTAIHADRERDVSLNERFAPFWAKLTSENGSGSYEFEEVHLPAWGGSGLDWLDPTRAKREGTCYEAGSDAAGITADETQRVHIWPTQAKDGTIRHLFFFSRVAIEWIGLTDKATISTGNTWHVIERDSGDALTGEHQYLYRFPNPPLSKLAVMGARIDFVRMWPPGIEAIAEATPGNPPGPYVLRASVRVRVITADFDPITVTWPGPTTYGSPFVETAMRAAVDSAGGIASLRINNGSGLEKTSPGGLPPVTGDYYGFRIDTTIACTGTKACYYLDFDRTPPGVGLMLAP